MVDIVGGLIFSIWWYRTSIRYVRYVDKVISLPFVGGKKIYEKYRKKDGRENEGRSGESVDRVSISQIDSINKLRESESSNRSTLN